MSTIGLFPLRLVLLPSERAPLHILEPRYKELIGECLANETEFGIVLLDSRGTRDFGTQAAIVEVVERFDDGRLNIVVEGTERFRLVEIQSERNFLTARIEPLEDASALPEQSVYDDCLAEFRRAAAAAGLELEEPVPDFRGLAFQLATAIRLGIDAKQELLEMTSEAERLSRVLELMDSAVQRIRGDIIARRASTNGHATDVGPLGSP